jgi:hypothetical protein
MNIKFYLIFIFLCVRFSIDGQEHVFSRADSLFNTGEFQLAALEYERAIYLTGKGRIKNTGRFKKSNCYKQMGEHGKALDELGQISLFTIKDSARYKVFKEQAIVAYLGGDFNLSYSKIKQIENLSKGNDYIQNLWPFKIIVLNETREWEKAREVLLDHAPEITENEELHVLLEMYEHPPRLKNPSTAKWLSYIPGLGHLYAGYPLEGMASFGINLAFLSFGAYQIYLGYYLTGYFIGAGGLSEFFFGSRARAGYLVERKNHHRVREYNNTIKEILLANTKMDL